jgi:hypothetical protein
MGLAAVGLLAAAACTPPPTPPVLPETVTPITPVEHKNVHVISHDPSTGGAGRHQTQVEPSALAQGSTIVSAVQSGRIEDGGSMDISWSTSTDGGSTWTTGTLPGLTSSDPNPGPYGRATDPVVAFDAKHGT